MRIKRAAPADMYEVQKMLLLVLTACFLTFMCVSLAMFALAGARLELSGMRRAIVLRILKNAPDQRAP